VVAVVAGEVEDSGPLAARRFAVQQAFEINTKLERVIAVSDRDVIGERRFDVVVAGFTPTVKPVDVRNAVRWTTNAAPVCDARDGAEMIVLREELRRGVVQCTALHAFDFTIARDEPFGVVT